MKTLIASLVAIAALAGSAQASSITTDVAATQIAEWCAPAKTYGH